MDEHELRAWLRLTTEPDLDAARIRLLLSVFGMPQDICTASTGSLARYLDAGLATRLRQAPEPEQAATIESALEWLRAPGHHLLTLADPHYPKALFDLSDPPPALFAQGRLETLAQPGIAIVGARSATPGGEENAAAFATHLAGQGWCIISGLARGVDGAAHQGALDAGPQGGGTIAVLGTGIDLVYPSAHRALAHRIAEHGLLLSEFPLGSRALPFHFPMRNRIVAALSRGVLVVEAAARSGSLITARLAGELGREVFAIPGSIHSPLARGCHALIRQGAKLVESGQDIVEDLRQQTLPGTRPSPAPPPAIAPDSPAGASPPQADASVATDTPKPAGSPQPIDAPAPATSPALDADGAALLGALGFDPAGLDILQARTGWDIAHLMRELSLLELSGALHRLPDGRYQRRG